MYQLHIQAGTPVETPTIDEVFKAGFEFFRVMRREELEREQLEQEQKLERKLQEEQKSRSYRYDNGRYDNSHTDSYEHRGEGLRHDYTKSG